MAAQRFAAAARFVLLEEVRFFFLNQLRKKELFKGKTSEFSGLRVLNVSRVVPQVGKRANVHLML